VDLKPDGHPVPVPSTTSQMQMVIPISDSSRTQRSAGAQLASPFLELLPITGVAISVFDQNRRATLIQTTDSTASRLEELQFDLGEGPSVDAFRTASLVRVPDLAAADRWPAFLQSAEDLAVGAIFAFPLMLGAAATGTVTCYRSTPGPLDDEAADIGVSLSRAIAGPAFRRAIVLAADESPDGDPPIESRREIHQATGMVLTQLGISATDALSRIRAYAFSSGHTVQEIAHDVVHRRLNFSELPE
jgi:hypothetical protein